MVAPKVLTAMLNAAPAKQVREAMLYAVIELEAGAEPPKEFRLFKAGENRTSKGVFIFSARSQQMVMEKFATEGAEKVIDYNHASNYPAYMVPDPATAGRAAGWHRIEVRNGGELWAVGVTWTPAAAAGLKAREWRYCSPTVGFEEDGEIVEYRNCAITNSPATYDAPPLMASQHQPPNDTKEKHLMTREQLIAFLGLSANATEADIQAALTKQKEQAAQTAQFSALAGTTDPSEALGKLRAATTDAAKVAELNAQLAQQAAAQKEAALNALIARGEAEGKITPATRDVMLNIGKTDIKQLEAFLSATTPVVPKPATEPTGSVTEGALTREDSIVGAMLSIDPAALTEHKKKIGSRPKTASWKPEAAPINK